MIEFAERAIRLLGSRNIDQLRADEASLFAIRYSIQTIGEAVRDLSAKAKSEMSDIPCDQLSGVRNRLTHGYASIRDEVLVDTIRLDLPIMLEALAIYRRTSGNS